MIIVTYKELLEIIEFRIQNNVEPILTEEEAEEYLGESVVTQLYKIREYTTNGMYNLYTHGFTHDDGKKILSDGFHRESEIISKEEFVQETGIKYPESLLTGMKQNDEGLIENSIIKFPSIVEQKIIVERLDAAFENIDKLKANAEKQLAEAQTLFQKSLAKAMEPKEGWEEKTLGQLGDLKNGMNFAHNEKGVDLHILGVGDFGNRFSIDDVRELQMISLNQQPSEDYLLKDGDIVFVRSNGNKQLVGRSLVVYPGDNSTTFSGFCIRFRKSLKVLDERFLVYLLKSDNTRKKLFGNGANISNLNQKTLQSLIVPLPPLAEQQRIVERLDALSENIRKYEEIQRQIISECDALKQALLRKVFE